MGRREDEIERLREEIARQDEELAWLREAAMHVEADVCFAIGEEFDARMGAVIERMQVSPEPRATSRGIRA